MPHITEKELLMVGDDLLEHETAIEKCGCYLRETQDPEIQTVLQRHQGTYQRHYQQLHQFTQRRPERQHAGASPAPGPGPDPASAPDPDTRPI